MGARSIIAQMSALWDRDSCSLWKFSGNGQGFLTNDNRLSERAGAAEIAFKSGQIKVEKRICLAKMSGRGISANGKCLVQLEVKTAALSN